MLLISKGKEGNLKRITFKEPDNLTLQLDCVQNKHFKEITEVYGDAVATIVNINNLRKHSLENYCHNFPKIHVDKKNLGCQSHKVGRVLAYHAADPGSITSIQYGPTYPAWSDS